MPLSSSRILRRGAAFLRRRIDSRLSPRLFHSYDEASRACSTSSYSRSRLAEIVFQKTVAYRDNISLGNLPLTLIDSPLAFAIGLLRDSTAGVTVLDFGGACGAHYYRMRALPTLWSTLRWHVVETPAMVEQAKSFESDELQFFETLEKATGHLDRIGVVHSSGTLHCLPDPCLQLRQLLALQPNYLVLSRLRLVQADKALFTVRSSRLGDHGPGSDHATDYEELVQTALHMPPQEEFESIIREQYEIILKDTQFDNVLTVGTHAVPMVCYVARRNDR